MWRERNQAWLRHGWLPDHRDTTQGADRMAGQYLITKPLRPSLRAQFDEHESPEIVAARQARGVAILFMVVSGFWAGVATLVWWLE
jgi:hypothetical protein